jgi:hypothetical protein
MIIATSTPVTLYIVLAWFLGLAGGACQVE